MSAIGRRKRFITYKEISNSKNQKLDKKIPNWSDLSRDVVECIIGRLHWADRICIRAVCKAWSFSNLHIPTIDRLPWAVTYFSWWPTKNSQLYCNCGLLDPLSRVYAVKESVKGIECKVFRDPIPCDSVYGWILFKTQRTLFLYSPFTTELIKLLKLDEFPIFQVASFSLNASSPKCIVFVLCMGSHKIYVKICSPGDYSWMILKFDNGLDWPNCAVDARYANGVFYCVFAGGQLGAFNVELKEWTILVDHPFLEFDTTLAKLIASDTDLLLLDHSDLESLKLYKFEFLEKRWVYAISLNNHVLFIGCTSFSAPAVGVTSELANNIFCSHRGDVRCYGSTSRSHRGLLVYRKCVEAARRAMAWIEVPFGGIWRAKDLINAV